MPPFDYAPRRKMLLDFIDVCTRTPQGWRLLERDTRPTLILEERRPGLPAAALVPGS